MFLLLAQHAGAERPISEPQAALVVQYGEGQYIVRVVTFSMPSITGMELLRCSGLDVIEDTGMICKIGHAGCDYPAEDCICKLPYYWSYWHWLDDGWNYSSVGAAGYAIEAGAVDGWSWGQAPLAGVEPEDIFDARRFAPGLPVIEVENANILASVDFWGDVNGNATVKGSWRLAGGAWSDPIFLDQQSNVHSGLIAEGLPPGEYEIEMCYDDPDGINGSANWMLTTTVSADWRLYVPCFLAPVTGNTWAR